MVEKVTLQTGQVTYETLGNGESQPISIPVQPTTKAFKVHDLTIFILDDNGNGTLAFPYPGNGSAAPTFPVSLVYIMPAGQVRPTSAPLDNSGPSSFALQLIGYPAVTITRLFADEGAGVGKSIWVLDSNREVIVPVGYALVVWVQDPGDGSPHPMNVSMFATIEWQECD